MKQSHPDRFDYHFRTQPLLFTPEAILLEYLKNGGDKIFSHKEMVFAALKGYWLPFAYRAFRQEGNAITNDELRRVAAEAERHLQQQLTFLQFSFQLHDLTLDEEPKTPSSESLIDQPENHVDDAPSNSTPAS